MSEGAVEFVGRISAALFEASWRDRFVEEFWTVYGTLRIRSEAGQKSCPFKMASK